MSGASFASEKNGRISWSYTNIPLLWVSPEDLIPIKIVFFD